MFIQLLLIVCVVVLFLMYGSLCYKQGRLSGITTGELMGIYEALLFLNKRKIIGLDRQNMDIYRIKDDGGRGETLKIVPADIPMTEV